MSFLFFQTKASIMMMINQLDMKDSNSCRSETTRIDYLIIKENHRETHIRKKKEYIYTDLCISVRIDLF